VVKVSASGFICIILTIVVRYPLIESLLLSEADNASTANVNSENYCLNEVDNANLPRDFTEMQDYRLFL